MGAEEKEESGTGDPVPKPCFCAAQQSLPKRSLLRYNLSMLFSRWLFLELTFSMDILSMTQAQYQEERRSEKNHR